MFNRRGAENNCVSRIIAYCCRAGILVHIINLHEKLHNKKSLVHIPETMIDGSSVIHQSWSHGFYVKHKKTTRRDSFLSENLTFSHSAFTIGRTFLSCFSEADYNKKPNNKRKKTTGMTIG